MRNQKNLQILETLFKHFSVDHRVQAIVLLGSMAENKDDAYSDIDLLIVTSLNDLNNLWLETEKYLVKEFDVLKIHKNFYQDENTNISVLTNDLSEFDIVFRTKENFQKKHSNPHYAYKILYNTLPDLEPKKFAVDEKLDTLLSDATKNIWQKYKTAAVAIKRNKFFVAIYEIDRIRDQLVEILVIKYGLRNFKYRGIENLQENYQTMLKDTYPKGFSYVDLKKSLLKCLDLLIYIFNECNQENDALQYQKLFNRYFEKIEF